MNDFLDKIFSNDNFIIILIVILVILFVLFILILFLGRKDQKLEETKRLEKIEETKRIEALNNTANLSFKEEETKTEVDISTKDDNKSFADKYPEILISNTPAVNEVNNNVNVEVNNSDNEKTINEMFFTNEEKTDDDSVNIMDNFVINMPVFEENESNDKVDIVENNISEMPTSLNEPESVNVVEFEKTNPSIKLDFDNVVEDIAIPNVEEVKEINISSDKKGEYAGVLNTSSVFSSVYVNPSENTDTNVINPVLEEVKEDIIIPNVKEELNIENVSTIVMPEVKIEPAPSSTFAFDEDDVEIDLSDMPTLKVDKAVNVKLPDVKSINLNNIKR